MKSQSLQSASNTPEDETDRGLGLSGDVNSLLLDPKASKKDLAIARRAIREKWPISESTRRHLVKRLVKVTRKEAVLVEWGQGDEKTLMPMDGPADANAISATKVLVQMMGQNQADEHHADEQANPQPPAGVNLNVAVQAGIAQEPEYLEWKREQFRRRHGDTSNVGCNGFAATILDAPPHLGNGQGSNGHDSGG